MIRNVNYLARPFLEPVRRKTCPSQFDDGVANIDLLLSELGPHEFALVDAALDLRIAAAKRANAAACLEHLFYLRTVLCGRHRIAFHRIRSWAGRALRVAVRINRGAPWIPFEIPADAARIEEVANTALAHLARSNFIPTGAQVRFVFSTLASDAISN